MLWSVRVRRMARPA